MIEEILKIIRIHSKEEGDLCVSGQLLLLKIIDNDSKKIPSTDFVFSLNQQTEDMKETARRAEAVQIMLGAMIDLIDDHDVSVHGCSLLRIVTSK